MNYRSVRRINQFCSRSCLRCGFDLAQNLPSSRHIFLRGIVAEYAVHVFQALTLRLWDGKPRPNCAQPTENCEESVRSKPTSAIDHGWGDEADDEVVDPFQGQ